MKTLLRYGSSFIAPLVMCVLLPYGIILLEHQGADRPWLNPAPLLALLGLGVLLAGLALFAESVRLFILIGRGTIMPWDPTRKLVVTSLYCYVRNPMILGVILIECGEALLFASPGIAGAALFFFILNTIYFRRFEEPGLVRRFGAEYEEYRRNVPMWVPRLTPWQPPAKP